MAKKATAAKLILAPSFDEHTRAEIEQHLEVVRQRRMLAAFSYAQGVNAKLEHESERIQKRMASHYDMLAKEIERLDKAHAAVEKRLETLTAMQQELGLTQSLFVVLDGEKSNDSQDSE
jgi:Pyruvate/2-oxoacid:ferredoxin oxidoreductase gamma subunit